MRCAPPASASLVQPRPGTRVQLRLERVDLCPAFCRAGTPGRHSQGACLESKHSWKLKDLALKKLIYHLRDICGTSTAPKHFTLSSRLSPLSLEGDEVQKYEVRSPKSEPKFIWFQTPKILQSRHQWGDVDGAEREHSAFSLQATIAGLRYRGGQCGIWVGEHFQSCPVRDKLFCPQDLTWNCAFWWIFISLSFAF
jgi:hypothetical protein